MTYLKKDSYYHQLLAKTYGPGKAEKLLASYFQPFDIETVKKTVSARVGKGKWIRKVI